MIYILLLFFCVLIEAFFAMFEMAIVSFNKVRLHFYLSKNYKIAHWLTFLLNKPSRLFGTTLIAISTVQQMGSELSRRFYESLNLSPDLAPFTQIFIILVFGELAPMFAARKYAEHAATLGVPVVYFVAKILSPIVWFIDLISKKINKIFNSQEESYLHLSKAEVKRVLEEQESPHLKSENISTITSNILFLKEKKANKMMSPIDSFHILNENFTVEHVRELLRKNYKTFILIKNSHNSLSIVFPKDLLIAQNSQQIKEFASIPWYVSENNSLLSILKESRQEVCILLNHKGQPSGVLTMDQIIDDIFGQTNVTKIKHLVIEKKLSGDMLLDDFNRQFNVNISCENAQNLSDLISSILGHQPVKGDTVYAGNFEFIVVEPSLLGAKTILVRTLPF